MAAETESEQTSSSCELSKKPKDTAFRQQRLPAWQPILTAGNVMPTFFVIGIAFIPIGIAMLLFSDKVNELEIDYTRCTNINMSDCSELVKYPNETCSCEIEFDVDKEWTGEVYMYYALTNFYQNHRRYVKSRDDSQLLGDIDKEPQSDCDPFDKNENGKKYVPCGAIANSLFSDVIRLSRKDNAGNNVEMKLQNRGIAWKSDKDYRFKNPPGDLKDALENADAVKPRDWPFELYELGVNEDDPNDTSNVGLQNEDLIVWMRTAALPNFRKLYRKIEDGLQPGKYVLNIEYRYRVVQFSGSKSIIFSTTSLLGGKNPFLGIAYVCVGSICLFMGVVFLFIHLKCGKQHQEDDDPVLLRCIQKQTSQF